MRIEVAGTTHVGMKRTHNEDNFLLLPEENLFCVADGMGGHASGEVASKLAVEELADFFRLTSRDQDATWPYKMDKSRNYDENRLATGIKLANARIYEQASSDPKFKGMGTTIVTVHFSHDAAYVGHVGDSRLYSYKAGALHQITEDHSLLTEYIKSKRLSPEEIEGFAYKNVILRALGMKDTVVVDTKRADPSDGEIFLLCSDGLSGMVPDPQMCELLRKHEANLEDACRALIDAANKAGGTDNVTCILVRFLKE